MYIRSSISAQSLASVPPSRALMVRIAPAASCGPLSSAFSLSSSMTASSRSTSARDLGGEGIVFARHFDHRLQVVAGRLRLVERFEHTEQRLRSATVSWAVSWSSQKPGAAISSSMALTRACLAVTVKESPAAGESRCGSLRRDRSILFPVPWSELHCGEIGRSHAIPTENSWRRGMRHYRTILALPTRAACRAGWAALDSLVWHAWFWQCRAESIRASRPICLLEQGHDVIGVFMRHGHQSPVACA